MLDKKQKDFVKKYFDKKDAVLAETPLKNWVYENDDKSYLVNLKEVMDEVCMWLNTPLPKGSVRLMRDDYFYDMIDDGKI